MIMTFVLSRRLRLGLVMGEAKHLGYEVGNL